MARTHKSLVSDFIKDMLFDNADTSDIKSKDSKMITKVLHDSPHWKTAVVNKENKASITKNINLGVNVGDVVAYNNTAINVKKVNPSNSCTIIASVNRGKIISVTQTKKNKQLMYVL